MLCGEDRCSGRGEDDDLEKINDKIIGKIFDKNTEKNLKDPLKNLKKKF